MNAEQARAILAQGLKDGTHETPIPEDDAKAISDAKDLLEMAQTAWDQMVRGPEVEILLKMEASFAEGGEAPEPKPKAKAKAKPRPKPKPEPEPEPEPEPTPEPEPEPQPDVAEYAEQVAAEEDYSQVLPWEGYDGEKVSDIIAGIDAAVSGPEAYSSDELADLMSNIWQYESAHKKRNTILNHLETVANQLAAPDEEETPPEEPPPSPEPEVVEQPAEEEQLVEEEAPAEDPPAETEAEPEPEEKPERPKPKAKPKPKAEKKKDDGEDDYEALMAQIEEELDAERLHRPEKPPEDVDLELPWDWTKMSNKELQRLHGAYSALAFYKQWQQTLDERKELFCKGYADELHNALMLSIDKHDEHGKEKRVAILEAEIESDPTIVTWRRRQKRHGTFAAAHKNELSSYNKIVEALSRQETMRHEEWERAGNRRG